MSLASDDCALIGSTGCTSGFAVLGVLNAPDDDCCSFSNSSCSSLGSLGGDGPGDHDDRTAGMDVKVRRKKPGRIVRMACVVEIMTAEGFASVDMFSVLAIVGIVFEERMSNANDFRSGVERAMPALRL